MSHRENITRIKAVYNALEELADQVVFVGGATVSLYGERPAGEVRPTDDVDILVEIINYPEYANVEAKLREKGFVNDVESGVICRYTVQGITVDIMPTSHEILGFANRWYKEAFKQSELINIDDQYTIRIFPPPYFIATKLEAFKDSGENDGRTSSDFEDIVYVLNNRTSIWKEMEDTSADLHTYLKDEFKNLLLVRYLEEWISAHLDYEEQNRAKLIINNMLQFDEPKV